MPEKHGIISILTINDVYEIEKNNGIGGLAELKTMIDAHRREKNGENMCVWGLKMAIFGCFLIENWIFEGLVC
jgi:hypothetical protein